MTCSYLSLSVYLFLLNLSVFVMDCTETFSLADLGYNALPFLIRSELLLFPVALLFAFYIVSLLGFNVSHVVLEGLFGR